MEQAAKWKQRTDGVILNPAQGAILDGIFDRIAERGVKIVLAHSLLKDDCIDASWARYLQVTNGSWS